MTDVATSRPAERYGVHSEVGLLRKVLVCAPGLAHERLTPSNCDDLLFDDVMWVQNARRDHFDFVSKMRERGVEVAELHNLLSDVLALPEARKWLLDRKIVANEVGLDLVDDTRAARRDHHARPRGGQLLRHEVADARVAARHDDRASGERRQRARIPDGCRRHSSTSPPEARRSW